MLLRGRQTRGGGGGEGIPEEVIALWSGTLANIPANWNLCDGTGGTPNLVARFLRGAPATTEPGTTGGSDTHTHASMTAAGTHTHVAQAGGNHTHVVNTAGLHVHSGVNGTRSGPITIAFDFSGVGVHDHTTNVATHTHTMDLYANHLHTIGVVDGRPPYYEVAFIQAGAGAVVALGLIIVWTGLLANIPAGWTLCDGGDSRPDLRTNFVRGVNTAITEPGGVGGNETHTHGLTGDIVHNHIAVDSTHFHTFNLFVWAHVHTFSSTANGLTSQIQTDSGGGNHTHANTDAINNHTHVLGNSTHLAAAHIVNTADSKPAYYDVAYIINTAAATIPTEGIIVWTGLLANIPTGYNLCDGGGGRPELRSKFLRGSADGIEPGGLGGSDTHTHTEAGNVGAHNDHSVALGGAAHQHAATDSIGNHTHTHTPGTPAIVQSPLGGISDLDNPSGDHSHTFNLEGAAHNDHILTSTGGHNHQPWSTDTVRPAFYEVAFIMKA